MAKGKEKKNSKIGDDEAKEQTSPKIRNSKAKGDGGTPKVEETKAKTRAVSPAMDLDDAYETPSSSPTESEEMDEDGDSMKNWPKEDDIQLFQQMKKILPKDDTMKYDSRLNYVEWHKVAFKSYDAEQCKARWIFVSGHLRHYRVLSEVLDDAAIWVNHPWANFNKGSKNNLKHPDLPKKPLTSYMLFYMDKKDQVAQENPGKGMTELSKIIAKMFHSLDAKKKTKYAERAEKAKLEHLKKMEKFMRDHPDYEDPKTFKSKLEVPKPPTPFNLYCAFRREELEEKSKSQALEICRLEYKALEDKEKFEWIKKASAQEPQYLAELEKFKSNNPDLPEPLKKPVLTKEEYQLKTKCEGLPEKPPNSGYSLFSRRMLRTDLNLKQYATKERMMQCSLLWKEMPEEERAGYAREAEALNLKYKMDYSAYVDKLSPEEKEVFLAKGGVKRPASKSEVSGKQLKKQDASADTNEYDSDLVSDDDDFEAPKKIQKPNSSLQMFCNSNMEKYQKKNPKMSKQELTRLMAKDFAKLGDEKKKVYDTMAQKSKKESAAKSNSKPTTQSSKKGAASAKFTIGSPKASTSNGTTSKTVSSPPSSPLKVKPSLNATAKPSPNAAASKTKAASKPKETPKSAEKPIWALHQNLFKHEPPKPPQTPQQYYASCTTKKPVEDLSQEDIDNRWKKLATAKRTKLIKDHKEMMTQFSATFEKFVRELPPDELKSFRLHVKVRDSGPNTRKEDSDESGSDEDQSESESGSEPGSGQEDSGDEEEDEENGNEEDSASEEESE